MPPAPVFTPDPIGDLAPALQVEARNVTHNSTVDLDHPVRRRAVAPQPRPPSLEARSIIDLSRGAVPGASTRPPSHLNGRSGDIRERGPREELSAASLSYPPQGRA